MALIEAVIQRSDSLLERCRRAIVKRNSGFTFKEGLEFIEDSISRANKILELRRKIHRQARESPPPLSRRCGRGGFLPLLRGEAEDPMEKSKADAAAKETARQEHAPDTAAAGDGPVAAEPQTKRPRVEEEPEDAAGATAPGAEPAEDDTDPEAIYCICQEYYGRTK